MRKLIYFIVAIFFVSCEDNAIEKTKKLNENNPYIKKYKNSSYNITKKDKEKNKINKQINKFEQNMKLEKLKIDNIQTLAKIKAQKEQKLKELEAKTKENIKKLELQKAKIESNKTLNLAKITNQTKLKIKEEESSLYKILIIVIGIVLILWIIIKYLISLAKKRKDIELEEKKMQHEAYIMDIKAKHEHIAKMLEIIKDENSDKDIKKSMTKILEKGKNNIIEYK